MTLSQITFVIGNQVNLDQALAVYRDCSLGARRPVDDRDRMRAMLRNANLVVTAWDGEMMVGIARSLSDQEYVTYVADLAVRTEYQRMGIGKELIRHTRAAAPKAELVLLAAPGAESYYEHIGFTHHPQAWTSKQTKQSAPSAAAEVPTENAPSSCG
jgi:GNAT superfamily N-acetyltransferase